MKTKHLISSSVVALLLGVGASAHAQSSECAVDSDCPDNFSCEVMEYDVCTDCDGGTDCEPGCFTETSSYCVPPPPKACDENTPCDGDDVCVTYTFEACTGAAPPREPCEEGTECPEPEPVEESCSTETESYCVPPYVAPCSVDADCGAGFTCEDLEVCSCSGSSGSVDPSEPSDGDTEPAPDEACVCEPSGEKYCQLIETECTSDADCAGELVCTDFAGDGDAPAIACADGEECPEPEPTEPVSYCAPQDFYWGGFAGGYDDAVAEATGHNGDVSGAEREEFFPVDGDDDGSSGGTKGDPSSCATATGGEPAGAALLLLGLVAARLRRRR